MNDFTVVRGDQNFEYEDNKRYLLFYCENGRCCSSIGSGKYIKEKVLPRRNTWESMEGFNWKWAEKVIENPDKFEWK